MYESKFVREILYWYAEGVAVYDICALMNHISDNVVNEVIDTYAPYLTIPLGVEYIRSYTEDETKTKTKTRYN